MPMAWWLHWCRMNNRTGMSKSANYRKAGPGRCHHQGKGRKASKLARILNGQSWY
jgi:hypothetical protein